MWAVMSKEKRYFYLKCIIVFALFVFFYGMTYNRYLALHLQENCISVRIQDNAIMKSKLSQTLEIMKLQEDPHIPELAAYYIQDHTMVTEKNLNQQASVSLYGTYGQMELIAAKSLVAGNLLTSEDDTGCVIDVDSAYDLFGSKDVLNQVIVIDDQEYYIRGLIESDLPTVMIQVQSKDAKFWNLELNYGEYQLGREYAIHFVDNYGLSNDYVIIEPKFLGDCLGNLLILPVALLVVILLLKQLKQIRLTYRKERKALFDKAYRMKMDWLRLFGHLIRDSLGPIVMIGLGGVAVVLFSRWFGTFPTRYLPSKWSDFNQYVSAWQDIQSQLKDLSCVAPTQKEVLLKQDSLCCVLYSVITLLLEWHAMDLYREWKKS